MGFPCCLVLTKVAAMMACFGCCFLAITIVEVEGQPPPSDLLPPFSWDTVPVFTHLADMSGYNETSIALLARYPLITIEKFMGPFPYNMTEGEASCEEDSIATVARGVKKISPETRVLQYLNSELSYPWYRLYQLADENGWWVVNASSSGGDFYTHDVINMNCSNPGHCPEVTVGYWDFADENLQAAWVSSCTGDWIDGCFVDGAKNDPPFGDDDNATRAAYEAGRDATFTAIAQKALLVINDKQYYDPLPPYPSAQGEFLETFSGSDVKWLDIMNRTADGHLVQAHTQSICKEPANSTDGIKDLAAFLMVAREYSYFGCSYWEDVPTWPAEYDQPLGQPLGPAWQDADGTWRRQFAYGTNCSINYGTGIASIDWGSR